MTNGHYVQTSLELYSRSTASCIAMAGGFMNAGIDKQEGVTREKCARARAGADLT
jgi:hypothetical protein